MIARHLERATDVRATVGDRPKQPGCMLANHPIWVVAKHAHSYRSYIILTRTADPFLALIAGERVHGPGPHLGIFVGEIRDELRNGGRVQMYLPPLVPASRHSTLNRPLSLRRLAITPPAEPEPITMKS